MKSKISNTVLMVLAGLFGIIGFFLTDPISVLIAILFMQYANGKG